MHNRKRGKATILLYHQVGDSPNKQTNLDCYCSTICFQEQMEYLFNSGIDVISLSDLIKKLITAEEFIKDYVVLTFDDGCNKFLTTVLPILEKYGFPSALYPVSDDLGEIASWPKTVNQDLKIISERELKILSQRGVEIGAHSKSHVKLTQVPHATAVLEVRESKLKLEHIIGKEIKSFSYPHGDYDKSIVRIIANAGFLCALTCDPFSIEGAENLLTLPRKYVTYLDDLKSFKNILAHEK